MKHAQIHDIPVYTAFAGISVDNMYLISCQTDQSDRCYLSCWETSRVRVLYRVDGVTKER